MSGRGRSVLCVVLWLGPGWRESIPAIHLRLDHTDQIVEAERCLLGRPSVPRGRVLDVEEPHGTAIGTTLLVEADEDPFEQIVPWVLSPIIDIRAGNTTVDRSATAPGTLRQHSDVVGERRLRCVAGLARVAVLANLVGLEHQAN